MQLGDGLVALVDEEQEVLGEVVEQAVGRLAGLAAVEVARVVLDALAVARLLDHLQVVEGALPQAVGLQVRGKLGQTLLEFPADRRRAPALVVLGGDHEVAGREDVDCLVGSDTTPAVDRVRSR